MAVKAAMRLWREACGTRSRASTASSTSPSLMSWRARPKAEDTVVGLDTHTSEYRRMAWKRSMAGSRVTMAHSGLTCPVSERWRKVLEGTS